MILTVVAGRIGVASAGMEKISDVQIPQNAVVGLIAEGEGEVSFDGSDELAKALLGFLQLPATIHLDLHFYLDRLDRNSCRFKGHMGVQRRGQAAVFQRLFT